MTHLKYRPDIDGLRAIAVLAVVIYHIAPAALPGGFLGVDIFFVISGYLISLIIFRELDGHTFRLVDFYVRRIRRLFPALLVVLAATLGMGAFALFADEYTQLGRHASSAIAFVLNFRLMGEAGYFDVASESKPLLHLWSLSVEEQFYLVWPLFLVLLGRWRSRIGSVIAVLFFASLLFAVWLSANAADALYFHPLGRFWELLAGAALAAVQHRGIRIRAFASVAHSAMFRNALSITGLLAIGLSFLFVSGKTSQPGLSTIPVILATVAMITCSPSAIGNRALSLQLLIWVGVISYPLYLWHWPILSFIRISESGEVGVALLGAGAALSLGLAALTYYFIEKPLRSFRIPRLRFAGLVLGMFLLLGASRAIISADGLPERSVLDYMTSVEAQMRREPSQDASCRKLFRAGDAPFYCRQESGGNRLIAIIGDSHAHVLFPGLAKRASDRGYGTLLLANSGCPPLLGATTGRNLKERQECAASIDTIVQAVLSEPRITSVIIATRGPQYLDGKGFGPAEADYNHPPIAPRPGVAVSAASSQEIFRQGLEQTIMRLHERGIAVSYLLQVPELGLPARNCLGRPLTLTERQSGCQVPYPVYQERMREYRELVMSVASMHGFLAVLDAEALFCDEITCSGNQNGQLLYADDNHLSVIGSDLIAPLLIRAAVGDDAATPRGLQ